MLGSPRFLYNVVQYDSTIHILRMQQVTQILLATSSNDSAMSTSAMELDALVVVTSQSDSEQSQQQTASNHRGLYLYLLSQFYKLRRPLSRQYMVHPELLLELAQCREAPQRCILDALMALLSQHMSTVHRIDFIALLTILYRNAPVVSATTTLTKEQRAISDTGIQCLLCVESMALW